jgi:replicative DNA helicase
MKDREYLEQVLIGKIINDKKIYYDNHSLLSEDLFTNSQHKKLYRVIDESLQKSGKCDMTDFYNKSKDKYEAIELARVCTERSYDPYLPDKLILVLLENNKMSELERLIVHVNRKIQDKDDLFEIISYTEEQLQKIGNVNNDKLVHISEQMPHMVKSIEKNVNNQGMTGIPSGFETIDRFTSGWQKQDLVIIGGASSMGKTSFALNMSVNAVKRGFKSVIFSYEMSVNQMLMRIVSGDSEIDNKHLLKGAIYQDEWTKIHKTIGNLERLPLYIDECRNTTLKYLLNRIRQYVVSKQIDMVVVDYLQLISYNLSGRSREQEVSHVTRALKNLAKELNITVLALSQLSRNVSKRDGGRPTLADLRESGEIEQAADTVIFVYRPEYYNILHDENGNSVKGLAEIIFAKGRNIGIGSKHLRFIDYLTKFENLPTM